MVNYIDRFRCNHCDGNHDDYTDAVNCCNSVVHEEGYQCPECHTLYIKEIDAAECCHYSDEEIYMIQMAELEKCGQQTLF